MGLPSGLSLPRHCLADAAAPGRKTFRCRSLRRLNCRDARILVRRRIAFSYRLTLPSRRTARASIQDHSNPLVGYICLEEFTGAGRIQKIFKLSVTPQAHNAMPDT